MKNKKNAHGFFRLTDLSMSQMQSVSNGPRRLRIKTRRQYDVQFTSRYDPFSKC